jgi:glycosyltransferase involved in cell wall biosynthesis
MKLSVVITAFNEEKKIEDCLKSVKNLADEIIFVDNSSSDKTLEIAKKYTEKVYVQENDPQKIDIKKNFGFKKAAGNWILSLDADERVTEELCDEINEILNSGREDINGYLIPRKNIIFGKWIEHTGWYPDYQLRLFKNGKGSFSQKHVHEQLRIDGKAEKLKNPLLHLNYDTVSQFLTRMITSYTISEADALLEKGYKYDSFDIIKMPVSEFVKRYFAEKGYKDGMHGLVLSSLMAFYHFVVFVRLWEEKNYPDEKNNEELISKAEKFIGKEFHYWIMQNKILDSKNILNRQVLKIKRKLSK